MPNKEVTLRLGNYCSIIVEHVSQGDTDWTWVFQVVDDHGQIYAPVVRYAILAGNKPDGHAFAYLCTMNGNTFQLPPSAYDIQMTAAAGNVKAELRLIGNNGKSLGTCNFTIRVEEGPEGAVTVASDSSLPAYLTILNKIGTIPDDVAGYIAEWLEAHISGGQGVAIDNTLSVQGAAADAKAAGDRLKALEEAIIETDDTLTVEGAAADAKAVGDALGGLFEYSFTSVAGYFKAGGSWSSPTAAEAEACTMYLPVKKGEKITFYYSTTSSHALWVRCTAFDAFRAYVSNFDNKVTGTERTCEFTVPDGVAFVAFSYSTFNDLTSVRVTKLMPRVDATLTLSDVPADALTVWQKLRNIQANDANVVADLGWEYGHIASDGTAPTGNKTRLRNSEYVAIGDNTQEILFSCDSGYKYGVYFYDNSNAVIRNTPQYDKWVTTPMRFVKPFGAASFKAVLARNDSANMVKADLDHFRIEMKANLNFIVDEMVPQLSADALTLTAQNYDFGWVEGNMNDDTGGPTIGTERLRSEYVRVGAGSIVRYTGSSYGVWIYRYDKDKNYLGHSGAYTNYFVVETDGYIRILIRLPSRTEEVQEREKQCVTVYRELPGGLVAAILESLYSDSAETDNLPPYYDAPIQTAIDNTKASMDTVGMDGDSFIWLSDVHWPNNVKVSWMAINRDMKAIPTLLNVINCGDTMNSASDGAVSAPEFMRLYMPAKGSLYNLVGNHDRACTNAQIYARLLKHMDGKVTYGGFGYFWFDNTATKTRYICLNTYDMNSSIDAAQLAWFSAVLEAMPDGYNALVFGHIFMDTPTHTGYEGAAITTQGTQIATASDAFNASHATKKVFAIFGGHTHFDAHIWSDGGIPIIMIDTDSTLACGPNTATGGTISESCIDVVTCDYTNKVVKCERIGRGESRVISYGS